MNMFDPPHPGEILKEDYLVPLGLTITEVAKRLRIARKNLSAIVNGHSRINPEMAIRLSKSFNTSPEMWMHMQKEYDLWIAQHRENEIVSFIQGPQTEKTY